MRYFLSVLMLSLVAATATATQNNSSTTSSAFATATTESVTTQKVLQADISGVIAGGAGSQKAGLVPEPEMLTLFAVGIAGMLLSRRRSK